MMVLPCVCVLLLFDVVHALSYASTNDIMGGIMLQASTPRQVALASQIILTPQATLSVYGVT